jgi:integrase
LISNELRQSKSARRFVRIAFFDVFPCGLRADFATLRWSLPNSGEATMKVWRKQTIRWRLKGINVPRGTPNAQRNVTLSRRFYGTIRLASGRLKQVPLADGRNDSRAILRRLQAEQDEYRSYGRSASFIRERQRPLLELLDEYEAFLAAKGNTSKYVAMQGKRIRKLLTTAKVKTLDDLDAGRILKALATWRTTLKRHGISASNHYLIAIKGFSRWLWTQRKSPDDPLVGLRRLNAETDRRRVRRPLTPDELQRLTSVTQNSRRTYGRASFRLTPTDRAMLYLTAAFTGLRANELATLTKASLDFGTNTLTLSASNTKNRKASTLPLHPALASRLQTWIGQTKRNTLWTIGDPDNAGECLKRDLKRAGIAYVDDRGRYADFHSLRYTFITSLALAGVHPSKAQRLARHSTINLTMNVYTSLDVDDLRDAVGALTMGD